MQKFIHDNFMIDLSGYKLTRVQENQWFSDSLFTKYVYPFELKLTKELAAAFGLIDNVLLNNVETLYNGYFFIEGGHEEAQLEIKDVEGKIAIIEISSGFEEFPSFDKKLAELSLEKQELNESLFDHALTVINKTFPEVNYNFVQMHTDSFSPEEERWNGFESIVNNYKNGAFLRNEFSDAEDVTYNRNLMIPMPYWLHVLIQGFKDGGYNLAGDILEDPDLQKMTFYRETEEYVNARIEGDVILHKVDDFVEKFERTFTYGFFSLVSVTTVLGRYEHEYTFPYRGKYKIAGNAYINRENSEGEVWIEFNGIRKFRAYEDLLHSGFSGKIRNVDFFVYVNDVSDKLILKSEQIPYGMINDATNLEASLWDLTVTPLAIYDDSGSLIPPVITTEKIDLTKCVPDALFGDLVKTVKNWKNMDLNIEGDTVFMNYIEPQMKTGNIVDLSMYNKKEPRRKFSQGETFLLKLKDVESEDYIPEQVFVDVKGVKTNGFTTNEETNEIVIDAVVPPNIFRNGVTTGLAVDNGESNMVAVLYGGLTGGLNIAGETTTILMPKTYENYWSKWIPFRIKSQGFVEEFKGTEQNLIDLNVKSRVFMYNSFFLIKVLNKTNIPGKEIIEVEVELERLKEAIH